MHTIFWLENPKRRDHSGDLGVGGKIILELISGRYGRKLWTGFIWLRKVSSGGLCEHDNELWDP
jgi:hypothetical protein